MKKKFFFENLLKMTAKCDPMMDCSYSRMFLVFVKSFHNQQTSTDRRKWKKNFFMKKKEKIIQEFITTIEYVLKEIENN